MKKLSIHKPVCPLGEIISLDLTTATVEEFKGFLAKYIYGFKVYLEDNSGGSTNLIDIRLDPRFIDYMKKFYDKESKPLITATPTQILADTPAQEYQELLSFLKNYEKPKDSPYYL